MLAILIALIIVGLVAYLVQTYVPMPAPLKTITLVAFVIVALVILFRLVGVLGVRF